MPGCHLYCSACRLVLLSHFNITMLFNDHILFQEYTPFKSVCLLYCLLHNQVSLSSYMSIETGLFFFLTFCCIIIPISGIIDHYCIRLDLKNCSFAVTRPTKLWMCRLKIFSWTSEIKIFLS